MDFKEFYSDVYFDVDSTINDIYIAKQGDTGSRGLYVTLINKGTIIDVTTETMTFYAEKPDKTRVLIVAIKDGTKFRVDYPNQLFAIKGMVKSELCLKGDTGEQISSKVFQIAVANSLQDGSIVSQNERDILDSAFELANDIVPRLKLLDVVLLESLQGELNLVKGKVSTIELEVLKKRNTVDKITENDLDELAKAKLNLVGTGSGTNGASAYDIAVINGFIGTEIEWLASLKGQDSVGDGSGGTTDIATTTINGLMSALDKVEVNKISTIETNVSELQTNKTDKSYVDNKVKVDVPLGAKFTDTTYTSATNLTNGLMSKEDKIKVESIPIDAKYTDTVVDVSGLVLKVVGKDLSTNDYSDLDKIEVGKVANKVDKAYVDVKVKTDVPVDAKFTDTTYTNASPLKDGLMSSLDKIEVDKVVTLTTDIDNLTARVETLETSGGVGSVATKVYGVKITKSNSNPETSVTYIDDAIGLVSMKSTSGLFNIGDWGDKFPFNQIKPCVVKDGVVNYYLNPNDYTQRADLTPSDITSGLDGDVMVEFPKIFWKFNNDGGSRYIQYSDKKVDVTYQCLAHMRGTKEVDKIYISAYLGHTLVGKTRSLSGKLPTGNKTLGTFRSESQANGIGYEQMTHYQTLMLQVLYTIAFKNLDSQLALGQGLVSGASPIVTGGTNKKGMFYGENTGTLQNKFCGIEDIYGNIRYFVDGLIFNATTNMMITNDGFNNTASAYTDFGIASSVALNGYISDIQGGTDTGFIPSSIVGGTSSTYYSDSGNVRPNVICTIGAYYDDKLVSGMYSLSGAFTVIEANDVIGTRLTYYK